MTNAWLSCHDSTMIQGQRAVTAFILIALRKREQSQYSPRRIRSRTNHGQSQDSFAQPRIRNGPSDFNSTDLY